MNLIETATRLVERLKKENLKFAVAGGLASSTYRKSKRMTDDLDFLIYSESGIEGKAREILTDFGLRIAEVREVDLKGGPKHAIKKKASPINMLMGRKEGQVGVDFILPTMPWFQRALDRAQSNKLNFGNLELPCLSVEDLIIAKFYSLSNNSSRFQDADDIKAFFESNSNIDLGYIVAQMTELFIEVPKLIEKSVPKELMKASRKIRKSIVNKTPKSTYQL